jgi:hypothetical protein
LPALSWPKNSLGTITITITITSAIRQFTSGSGFRAETHRLDILGHCAVCTG